MANREIKKTNCSLCGYLCGLTAHMADGRIARLEPDPSRYPYNAAIVKGCARCRRNLELLDHPMRLNYPMRRVGERGSGRWERISWDQALDEIAARLKPAERGARAGDAGDGHRRAAHRILAAPSLHESLRQSEQHGHRADLLEPSHLGRRNNVWLAPR